MRFLEKSISEAVGLLGHSQSVAENASSAIAPPVGERPRGDDTASQRAGVREDCVDVTTPLKRPRDQQ